MSDERNAPTNLPPHPPADMLDSYMSRYDYDYNRDPGGNMNNNNNNNGESTSGHVRNRPIFATGHPSHTGDADDADGGINQTVYQKDYRGDGTTPEDQDALARAALASLQQTNSDNVHMNHTFTRDGYTPAPQPHLGGAHPESVYKVDYTNAPPNNNNGGGGKDRDTALYSGAHAVPYKADLLCPNKDEDNNADDGTRGVAPKIGSREALVPTDAFLRQSQRAVPPMVDQHGSSLAPGGSGNNPDGGAGRDYNLTSYDYGDTSTAQRKGQLPQGLDGSRHAHLLGTEREPAKMLDLLAGRNRNNNNNDLNKTNTTREMKDLTNPVYMRPSEKETAAVSRRLENEGNIHGQTIYKSDFIDQKQLPELPGSAASGNADVRHTNTDHTATSGERVAGVLTRDGREQGKLRNAHGTLISGASNATMGAEAVATMRREEKVLEIDKADPHRHKLH